MESVNDVARTGLPATADRTDADRQEIRQLAEQFEAMLMTQMLREMRRSMLDDEDEQDGLGAGPLIDTGDIEFGNAMSRHGGLGLADQMIQVFERQIAALTRGSAAGAETDGMPAIGHRPVAAMPALGILPTAAPAVALSDITAAAPVSSGFGWRRDPMTGAARFHQGIDIAVAYGRDVKSAAEGVVSFAGVQGGYGQTVIVDHNDGRQTRYAHLSEPLVRSGEAVAEGQVVGKSGNSGRSTGPHLHFEMLVNGRAVDPRGHTE